MFVVGSLADVRGDARTNLDILGRLGVTVVEIADEQSWELHFSEISQCTLIVDAIFGTGLKSPLTRHAGNGGRRRQRVGHSDRVDRSAERAVRRHAAPDRRLHRRAMTVTLAAPKLPLVLPPGEAHAGDVVIADIGIPHEVIDGARRPAHRAADAGAAARASSSRARPTRTRATSAASRSSPARAARPARRIWPAWRRCARAPAS